MKVSNKSTPLETVELERLEELRASALRLVDRLPGSILRILPEVLASRCHRQEKADGSYVTAGDLLLHEHLRKEVAAYFPDGGLVSEEGEVEIEPGHVEGTVIVVDPLDGTENFTSGLPEWGVSVASYHDGVHLASLIGCPEMNVWLKTGEKITRCTSRIRGLSSSLRKEDLPFVGEGYEYRMLGCCVYNMINVIRGSFCSFENPRGACSWDILAGLNLALEHGLKVLLEAEEYAGEYLETIGRYRFKIGQREDLHYWQGTKPGRH